ncbi:unnamed protein product [Rotaria socialis]|uniref:F-box domain-containing protein n=1 Tax=Rotaria socialis TaxID=392032 RepID=A0A818CI62_9BILA|nr:unnamed protein product [Rotaria socialis]CAF4357283.1 unnamed protein product [Rotaria socialis]
MADSTINQLNKDTKQNPAESSTHIATLVSHNNCIPETKSCFETLPNEILLYIASYLSLSEYLQAFFNLNQRFRSLAFEFISHARVSFDEDSLILNDYLPYIAHAVQAAHVDIQLVPNTFPATYSWSNLRSVILTDSIYFAATLNVQNSSVMHAIMSCLNIFQKCTPSSETNLELDNNQQIRTLLNMEPNLTIVRLTIDIWDEESLLCLCSITPNLASLRIFNLYSNDDDSSHSTIASHITSPTKLTELFIGNRGNFGIRLRSIQRLIECYRSSLEKLTLYIRAGKQKFYGQDLEALFRSCQCLKKFQFAIRYYDRHINMNQLVQQFLTDWWLHKDQPPVLVTYDLANEVFICSMPPFVNLNRQFLSDLLLWEINKKQVDEPNV